MENTRWIEVRDKNHLQDYIIDFGIYLTDFLKRGKIPDSYDNYFDMVINNIGNSKFGFFVSVENDKFTGFLITFLKRSIEENGLTCEVVATYIKPGANKKTWDKGFPVVEEWAANRGCIDLSMRSQRNPKAFMKKHLRSKGFVPYAILLQPNGIDVKAVLFRKLLEREEL